MPTMPTADFADVHHVERLRSCLWSGRQYGRAAVLVGAGTSANADYVGSTVARQMPMFRELASTMWGRLNSSHPSEAPDGIDPIETASDFESIFQRQVLNDFLRTELADASFRPSRLHRLLVSLPWADIFTTNYDTLLERASGEVVDRRYRVVSTHAALAGSTKPRIVKLHGSFPDHLPFIITTEDYRRYPQTYPGFVNTIRQAVMECALCLVGFGGTDPNFLAWSGWVRDVLGETAPPIYLVGVLDLDVRRRTILTTRGVVPIDLGPVFPKADWPDSPVRHRVANEWFLLELAVSDPDPMSWPNQLPRTASEAWHREPWMPDRTTTEIARAPTTLPAGVDCMLSYPGWLACPRSARMSLKSILSKNYDQIEQALAGDDLRLVMDILLQLMRAFTSLGWPMSEARLARARAVLYAARDDSDAWFRFALGYLTQLRFRMQWEEHEVLSASLRELAETREVWRAELCRELARRALVRMDYPGLAVAMKNWPPLPDAFQLELDRATLLVEAGEYDVAIRVVAETLLRVRSANADDMDLGLLAIEGAAMTFLRIGAWRNPDLMKTHGPDGRYRELGQWDCDPRVYFEDAQRCLRVSPRPQVAIRKSFDIGRAIVSTRWDDPASQHFSEALAALGLFESFALPFRCESSVFQLDLAVDAAKAIALRCPTEALSVFLRAEKIDAVEATFDRLYVARVEAEAIRQLADAGKRAVAQMEQARPAPAWAKPSRLAILLEVLSRVATLLESEDVRSILTHALSQAERPQLQHDIGLAKAVQHCLIRCFAALPAETRMSYVVRLLSLPLPVASSVAVGTRSWVDPISVVAIPKSIPESERQNWRPAVKHLLVSAMSQQLEERSASLTRLARLSTTNNLDTDQAEEFGVVLWSQRNSNGDPVGFTGYLPHALLILPGGPDQYGVQLRERLLGAPFPSSAGRLGSERNRAEGRCSVHFQAVGQLLGHQDEPLLPQQATQLLTKAERWLRAHKARAPDPLAHGVDAPVAYLVRLLSEHVFPRIEYSDLDARVVAQTFVELLRTGSTYLEAEFAYDVQRLGVVDASLAMQTLIDGLGAPDTEAVVSAARGIVRWFARTSEPPEELKRRLIYYLHRPGSRAFPRVVDEVANLVNERHAVLSDLDVEWMIGAVDRLLNETDLTKVTNDALYADPQWMPDTRVAAAALASALWKAFPGQRERLIRWRKSSQTDSLPEVRAISWGG